MSTSSGELASFLDPTRSLMPHTAVAQRPAFLVSQDPQLPPPGTFELGPPSQESAFSSQPATASLAERPVYDLPLGELDSNIFVSGASVQQAPQSKPAHPRTYSKFTEEEEDQIIQWATEIHATKKVDDRLGRSRDSYKEARVWLANKATAKLSRFSTGDGNCGKITECNIKTLLESSRQEGVALLKLQKSHEKLTSGQTHEPSIRGASEIDMDWALDCIKSDVYNLAVQHYQKKLDTEDAAITESIETLTSVAYVREKVSNKNRALELYDFLKRYFKSDVFVTSSLIRDCLKILKLDQYLPIDHYDELMRLEDDPECGLETVTVLKNQENVLSKQGVNWTRKKATLKKKRSNLSAQFTDLKRSLSNYASMGKDHPIQIEELLESGLMANVESALSQDDHTGLNEPSIHDSSREINDVDDAHENIIQSSGFHDELEREVNDFETTDLINDDEYISESSSAHSNDDDMDDDIDVNGQSY